MLRILQNVQTGSKASACDAGYVGSIPGSGRSPGEGNDNPLQYSCLGNPIQRNLVGYSPWDGKRAGHGLVTKPQQKYFNKQEAKYFNKNFLRNKINIKIYGEQNIK